MARCSPFRRLGANDRFPAKSGNLGHYPPSLVSLSRSAALPVHPRWRQRPSRQAVSLREVSGAILSKTQDFKPR
jgi:hypothetical protein